MWDPVRIGGSYRQRPRSVPVQGNDGIAQVPRATAAVREHDKGLELVQGEMPKATTPAKEPMWETAMAALLLSVAGIEALEAFDDFCFF